MKYLVLLLLVGCAHTPNCNPPPPDIATCTCNPDGTAGNCS